MVKNNVSSTYKNRCCSDKINESERIPLMMVLFIILCFVRLKISTYNWIQSYWEKLFIFEKNKQFGRKIRYAILFAENSKQK